MTHNRELTNENTESAYAQGVGEAKCSKWDQTEMMLHAGLTAAHHEDSMPCRPLSKVRNTERNEAKEKKAVLKVHQGTGTNSAWRHGSCHTPCSLPLACLLHPQQSSSWHNQRVGISFQVFLSLTEDFLAARALASAATAAAAADTQGTMN
jgi:hypothetical protein